MHTGIKCGEDSKKTEDIWIAVENNEQVRTERFKQVPAGKVSLIREKLSKTIKRKSNSINEVKLTIEKAEKIEITHSEIAHWLDTKARWKFPMLKGGAKKNSRS